MSSHQFEPVIKETEYIFSVCNLAFACCFGLGLGVLMGYQLHEQTTPAAEVAQMAASNTNKIREIEMWKESVSSFTVDELNEMCPAVTGIIVGCYGDGCKGKHYVSTSTARGGWLPR
jgi:hypothetical protein